jgi:hypothetical protein
MKQLLVALVLGLSLTVAPPANAETLVTKGGDGTFGPGLAASWQASGNTVVFELTEGADAAAIAEFLGDRLASARVFEKDGRIMVDGLPEATLLEQLSALDISAEADPLADLAGLEGAMASMQGPEGGGSIRASRPSGDSAKPRVIKEHDPTERFKAEVIAIKRGEFPLVTLKVRVRSSPKKGALRARLRRGTIVSGAVVMQSTAAGVDFNVTPSQRNLVAYYLAKGDEVMVHGLPHSSGDIEIDWIIRRGVKLSK